MTFIGYPTNIKMGGSTHSTESIGYSMKELGASIEVIKILKEGYSLPFTRLPGQKNNHSAKKHAVALWGKMLRVGKDGILLKTKE